jgi:GTPase SAR1 family protein
MVLMGLNDSNKISIKILYWGIGGSGKTTIVDTLYKLPREERIDIEPVGNLIKIAKASEATLYYDRGTFHSSKQNSTIYHVYTVAGQSSYFPLRQKVFENPPTDGVIFVVDSQIRHFEDNIESLKELKSISNERLVKEIPLIVMLNKQDLPDVIEEDDFKQVLKNQNLWYEPKNKLSLWNPIIYKTCALFEQRRDIYRSFSECVRRTSLYKVYGNGKAPVNDKYKSLKGIQY